MEYLYLYIKKTPGIRIPELSQKLHVPVKTLERWIKQLRNEKKIIFEGAPKTGGYYIEKTSSRHTDTPN